MPSFALSVSQRKDAYLIFLPYWVENITLTLLGNWAILWGQQRTTQCVCVCVCPQFFHLKEPPKEKLNNTLALTKSSKQLCPHVFLDLKVLYLNSFQIMSKKNDVTVYVGSHKVLYLFHTIQIVSREFFLLISWRTSLSPRLAPSPSLPQRVRSPCLWPPSPKRGKIKVQSRAK